MLWWICCLGRLTWLWLLRYLNQLWIPRSLHQLLPSEAQHVFGSNVGGHCVVLCVCGMYWRFFCVCCKFRPFSHRLSRHSPTARLESISEFKPSSKDICQSSQQVVSRRIFSVLSMSPYLAMLLCVRWGVLHFQIKSQNKMSRGRVCSPNLWYLTCAQLKNCKRETITC